MYRVILEPRANREYKKLPRDAAGRIRAVIMDELRKNPFASFLDVKKLKMPLVGYRLRVGDYRILFSVDGLFIKIYSIRHRKDAYR